MIVPIDRDARDWLPPIDDFSARSVALRHAAIHDRPVLWGDDPDEPSVVVWLRKGDNGRWEAFGSGEPDPLMLDWLALWAGGRSVAMLAPSSWDAPVQALSDRFERSTVETFVRPVESIGKTRPIPVRRLGLDDAVAFESLGPSWASRSWGGFARMIDRGAAFGISGGQGLVAAAWIYESDGHAEKIGVQTEARFQRLGLGRAVASRLVEEIQDERGRTPLWVAHASNQGSKPLAGSLGFVLKTTETLIEWTPRIGLSSG